jgi:hypothetical protein
MQHQSQQTATDTAANGAPETEQPIQPQQRNGSLLDEVISSGRFGAERERLRFEEERFTFQQRRARLYAKSGLFAGQKDLTEEQAIAQAMVRIELGASMGFSEAEALQGIRVINGETSIAAALRAARMQAAGYSWSVEWLGTEDNCEGCRLWLSFKGHPMVDPAGNPVSVAFTKTDATKMLTTLWENGNKKRASILEKENWKMSPRNMYFARAVTNAQRFYAPGVLSVNLPSIEEAQDFSDSRGQAEEIPEGVYQGTRADQQRIAEQKIAELRAQKNAVPAEATNEREARGESQPETKQPEEGELTAEENRKLDAEITAQEAPTHARPKPVFGRGRD